MDGYTTSYPDASPQSAQAKPHLEMFCSPSAPSFFAAESPASPYSSNSSSSFPNQSPLAESPLDMESPIHASPDNVRHDYASFPQGGAQNWNLATPSTDPSDPYHHEYAEVYVDPGPNSMSTFSASQSVPRMLPGRWSPNPNSQPHQYPQHQRRAQDRYRSFTQVGHISLSSDGPSDSGINATPAGYHPYSQPMRHGIRHGAEGLEGDYGQNVADIHAPFSMQSGHNYGPASLSPTRPYPQAHPSHSTPVKREPEHSIFDAAVFSPRSAMNTSPSDTRVYGSFSRTNGVHHPRTPNMQLPQHSAPLPVPTHRPRPMYAYNDSVTVGSYSSASHENHRHGNTREPDISLTRPFNGMGAGCHTPYTRRMIGDGPGGGMESSSTLSTIRQVLVKEEAEDDEYTTAHLAPHINEGRNLAIMDLEGDEDAEGEDMIGEDGPHAWDDQADGGFGESVCRSGKINASSRLPPRLRSSMSTKYDVYPSFSSDGSLSDDFDPAPSTSPVDSTASSTTRIRRHAAGLPGPIPVPNLTKKSRGRRVPTAASPGAGKDGYEGGRNSRAYTCDAAGCGKCFARGEHLKRHVRSIHTYEKRKPHY